MSETIEYSTEHPSARCPDCGAPLRWGKRQRREAWWCPTMTCPSFMQTQPIAGPPAQDAHE